MYDMHGCPALKPFSRSDSVDIVCSPKHIVFTSKYPVRFNTHIAGTKRLITMSGRCQLD